MKADLHLHTTYSDGLKTAVEVITKAKRIGLDVISITDHDICTGVTENLVLAEELGIRYIPGIELSTTHKNKPVHLLGYFMDDSYQSTEMLEYYVSIKFGREERAKKFISNLDKYFKIKITYEEVQNYSNGIIARPHIAKAVNYNYPEYTLDYIFEHFIGDHSIAYVPTCELSILEGIELLKRNNCIVVLAHPVLLKKNILNEVLSYDYDGYEARYFRNKEGDEKFFTNLAYKKQMIITAGSDYHGQKGDTKHGEIGEVVLDSNDLTVFLNKFPKL